MQFAFLLHVELLGIVFSSQDRDSIAAGIHCKCVSWSVSRVEFCTLVFFCFSLNNFLLA